MRPKTKLSALTGPKMRPELRCKTTLPVRNVIYNHFCDSCSS